MTTLMRKNRCPVLVPANPFIHSKVLFTVLLICSSSVAVSRSAFWTLLLVRVQLNLNVVLLLWFPSAGQNEGTLSIVEGELLSVVEEDKGDGWTRVRRNLEEEGYVPTSYIKVFMDSSAKGAMTYIWPQCDLFWTSAWPSPSPKLHGFIYSIWPLNDNKLIYMWPPHDMDIWNWMKDRIGSPLWTLQGRVELEGGWSLKMVRGLRVGGTWLWGGA